MKIRGTDENGNSRYVIEVQNECNTKDVTEEDAQKLKRKLESVGIKCRDMSKENIGRTIIPNNRTLPIGTIDNPEINGSYNVGIDERKIEPGEVVITDADCIYYEGKESKKNTQLENEER